MTETTTPAGEQDDSRCYAVPKKSPAELPTPNGASAEIRLVTAIQDLRTAFLICGLEPPEAILVAPGQERYLDWILRNSVFCLVEDKRCKELSLHGVKIREIKS